MLANFQQLNVITIMLLLIARAQDHCLGLASHHLNCLAFQQFKLRMVDILLKFHLHCG